MFKVRMRDLALVAVAGGLLAFELVSIGEALPQVKQALAERGLTGKALVASASAAGVTIPAVESAPAPVSEAAVAETVTRHAHVAAAGSAKGKACVVVTRARSTQRSRPRARVVSLKSDGSCSTGEVAVSISVDRLREASKAVDLALKHSTL